MASYCSFTAVEHARAREYRGTEEILIGCFGKCLSIKKSGGRRFKIGLRLSFPPEFYLRSEMKIEPDLR